MENTPVLLLVFNRPDLTKKLFDVIKSVKPAKLYIVADGPREDVPGEQESCQMVRDIFQDIDWKCDVHKLYREKNMGCDSSIIDGISWFFSQEEQGVILEDDCIPSKSFFRFCGELLKKYKEDTTISYISGSTLCDKPLSRTVNYYISDVMFLWGWATWRRVWIEIDWKKRYSNQEVREKLSQTYKNKEYIDMVCNNTLAASHKQMACWDTFFFLHILFNNKKGIMPASNQVSNIGNTGTHYVRSKSDLFNCKRYEIEVTPHFVENSEVLSDKKQQEIISNYINKTTNKVTFRDVLYLLKKKLKEKFKIK